MKNNRIYIRDTGLYYLKKQRVRNYFRIGPNGKLQFSDKYDYKLGYTGETLSLGIEKPNIKTR